MIFTGIVKSGKGDFSFWLDKLAEHYTRKLGVKLFPGTLNVHLINQSYRIPSDCIRLEKEEYGGTVSVSIGKCRIFGREAFILRTDSDTGKLGDSPESILEIASDVNFRQTYGLKDEDVVEVEIEDTGN
ncbi:MAG: DUF120 domain-containing protein [Phycisphaerae bacterium]|jgi:CTP-dependent riboflavin kinase|nr:DUF120 domain-containing protein [Phycisphaerae bacterium]